MRFRLSFTLKKKQKTKTRMKTGALKIDLKSGTVWTHSVSSLDGWRKIEAFDWKRCQEKGHVLSFPSALPDVLVSTMGENACVYEWIPIRVSKWKQNKNTSVVQNILFHFRWDGSENQEQNLVQSTTKVKYCGRKPCWARIKNSPVVPSDRFWRAIRGLGLNLKLAEFPSRPNIHRFNKTPWRASPVFNVPSRQIVFVDRVFLAWFSNSFPAVFSLCAFGTGPCRSLPMCFGWQCWVNITDSTISDK